MTITTAPELNSRISGLYSGAENLRKAVAQAKYRITTKINTNLNLSEAAQIETKISLKEATVLSAFIDKYEISLYQLRDFISAIGSNSKQFAAPSGTAVLGGLKQQFNKNIIYFRSESEKMVNNNKNQNLNSKKITYLAEQFAFISKKLTFLQDGVFGGPATHGQITILTAADLISLVEKHIVQNMMVIESKISEFFKSY